MEKTNKMKTISSCQVSAIDKAGELLEEWGIAAREVQRPPNGYGRNILSTLRGSALRSAKIEYETFMEIDRMLTDIKRHAVDQYNVAFYYWVKGLPLPKVARSIGISEQTAWNYKTYVVWWVASGLVSAGIVDRTI